MRRAVVGAATVLAAVLVLSGCMPEPAPSPTPTGFADEDAAFAAAEATYRAYVDALNRVDLSDPATFEDVYRWTTGELNASDRKGLSAYHARGLNLNGASEILTLDRHQASADFNAVSLDVCLDVSQIELTDPSGLSQVSPDRVGVQKLRTELVQVDPGLMKISAVTGREDGRNC